MKNFQRGVIMGSLQAIDFHILNLHDILLKIHIPKSEPLLGLVINSLTHLTHSQRNASTLTDESTRLYPWCMCVWGSDVHFHKAKGVLLPEGGIDIV